MRIVPLVRTILWMAAARECVCAPSHLTIAVFNYAGAPREVLNQAAQTARFAYRAAGIESTWLICAPGQKPEQDSDLELMVMKQPTGLKTHASEAAGLALVGSELPRPRAYAFYSVAEAAAIGAVRPVGTVLGWVLAHESAHLLGLRHQPSGVMRAYINAYDVDAMVIGRPFNVGEIRQLRSEVVRLNEREVRLMAGRRR